VVLVGRSGITRDTMPEPIHFHSDLYRRDAVASAARKYHTQARVDLADSGTLIVAELAPVAPMADDEWRALRDEFCNEALSATAQTLRNLPADDSQPRVPLEADGSAPPWALLAPFTEGSRLGLGWVLESLSPVRAGAAVLLLRHAQHGTARVTIRRNGGSPVGIAHTEHLDFMLMNGGRGTAQTERSIEKVLAFLAAVLRKKGNGTSTGNLLALLLPHSDKPAVGTTGGAPARAVRRVAPQIDLEGRTVSFDFDASGLNRTTLYDAILSFADRCYVFLTRPDGARINVQLKVRGDASTDTIRVLARDVTNALNRVVRAPAGGSAAASTAHAGLPPLLRRRGNLDALLAELQAADPATVGLGFQPERGPGHENLRILNIRGTGACNSECAFCIEKFNPTHRPMPKTDATRDLIMNSAGQYDMLFFASGEPTIHPRLFEHVELARSVGFTCFGMSSHFRTFADPHFALKTLQAGFEYFDIALHAADRASQLEVNPIGDNGESLYEALKGLAVLFRLAEALGVRISVTQKIVVSRLNVLQLEPVLRACYDRGVRHFILQPVRTLGLAPELQAKLAITEEEMIPHLNELLRRTERLGAVVKPYGFSRQHLFSAEHVESEQNRVKNIYGKSRRRDEPGPMPATVEARPTDGRHWVELREWPRECFGFVSDGSAPVLDDALERGVNLNFGCRMGSCGMCCARLLEGRVDQSNQIFLSEEQIAEGFVLLCQARPLSDIVVQMCTEDEIDEL
jgi:ferredoxin